MKIYFYAEKSDEITHFSRWYNQPRLFVVPGDNYHTANLASTFVLPVAVTCNLPVMVIILRNPPYLNVYLTCNSDSYHTANLIPPQHLSYLWRLSLWEPHLNVCLTCDGYHRTSPQPLILPVTVTFVLPVTVITQRTSPHSVAVIREPHLNVFLIRDLPLTPVLPFLQKWRLSHYEPSPPPPTLTFTVPVDVTVITPEDSHLNSPLRRRLRVWKPRDIMSFGYDAPTHHFNDGYSA